ncbi:hypothetical protein [Cytobacillus sp. NCCP-133]|uniref:hypothetical protein n=1 Tax=Cytobacillus sp. NCCP-133 TaxID=766848 RepID=UPI00223127E6|nr:hypothetical protein [Cytobacillus sp. NCCP-133]GLB60147.1 hypothetical protein NCCP133_22790 [Cytobacillus sp. NCCP-133]
MLSYTVIDTHDEDPTSLDAMTVVNMETEEIFIIYVSADASGKHGKKDILTDFL